MITRHFAACAMSLPRNALTRSVRPSGAWSSNRYRAPARSRSTISRVYVSTSDSPVTAQHLPRLGDSLLVPPVEHPLLDLPAADQPGPAEHLEMLTIGRLAQLMGFPRRGVSIWVRPVRSGVR